MKKQKHIHIRCDEALIKNVEEIVKRFPEISVSSFIRQAIREEIRRRENRTEREMHYV